MVRITWPTVGLRLQTKSGDWYTVLQVKGCNDIRIKFDIEGIEKTVCKGNITTGSIRLGKYRIGQKFKDKNGNDVELINLTKGIATFKWEDGYTRTCQISVIPAGTLMREEDSIKLNPKIKIGSIWSTRDGSSLEVIELLKNQNVKIRFIAPVEYEDIVQYGNILSGSISNKFKPSVCDRGFLGEYPVDVKSKLYTSWSGMLKRVYNSVTEVAKLNYGNCEVDEKWFYIGNYADWFNKQIVQDKWQLDKDLLVPGNKIYCEQCCVFLPKEINTFLTNRANHRGEWPIGVTYHARLGKWQATCSTNGKGNGYIGIYTSPEEAFAAYKIVKERYARELAEKWKGVIDDRAYEALLKFDVLNYMN